MKKKITVILEIESDDEFMINDEFIKNDLMAEINCASNSYDLISIDIEKTQLRHKEKPMIEPINQKEIRNQIEYIKEFLEEHREDWYVYSTLMDKVKKLEIMLEREGII